MNVKTILEEFKTAWKMGSAITIEVWENPTPKELRASVKKYGDNRWAANNKTKKLYVFTPDIIHNDFFVKMGFGEMVDEKTGDWFTGVYDASGGIYSDFMEHMVVNNEHKKIAKKVLKQKWDWINKYLPGFNQWYDEIKKEWKKEV